MGRAGGSGLEGYRPAAAKIVMLMIRRVRLRSQQRRTWRRLGSGIFAGLGVVAVVVVNGGDVTVTGWKVDTAGFQRPTPTVKAPSGHLTK